MNDNDKKMLSIIDNETLMMFISYDDREKIIDYFKLYATNEDKEIVESIISKFKETKPNPIYISLGSKYAKNIASTQLKNIDLTLFTKSFLLMFFKLDLFYNPEIIEKIEAL